LFILRKQLYNGLSVLFLMLAFAAFFASCKKAVAPPASVLPPVVPIPPVTYSLVWADEFDGNSVDTTKWTFDNRNAGVNNEKEYYLPSNVSVSDGSLVITAKKDSFGGQPYTSGKITTFNKLSPLYGRIEARIKMPMGAGIWPAFWMMGANVNTVNWPTCGEIDIMEHVNGDNIIYGTMHWNNGGHVSWGANTTTTAESYHVYAVEWDTGSIRWYVDNELYLTGDIHENVNGTDAFHLPFFLILNLAVGGTFPGPAIDNSKFPESMYVDYVRVYKAN